MVTRSSALRKARSVSAWLKRRAWRPTRGTPSGPSSFPRPAGPYTVFYTAIIGDYDDLPTFVAYDAAARYVCFSDSVGAEEIPDPWELVQVDSYFADSKVTSGFLKTNAHLLFDSDCVAVWVDANLREIALDSRSCADLLSGRSVAAPPHLERSTVSEEAAVVAEWGLDHPARVTRLKRHLAAVGFPDDRGLTATMLLIRDLRDPRVAVFGNAWWDGVARLSRRDQLTFDLALWQAGLTASTIPVDWRESNDIFTRVGHLPAADVVRTFASDPTPGSDPQRLLKPSMPFLPAEYPRVEVWHPETWDVPTLTVLRELNRLVAASGERFEGNYCHFHEAVVSAATPPDPRRSWKREFLRQAAQPARSVLEVGFNAGHSSALILGCAGVRHVTAVDLGEHAYARDCARALETAYPGLVSVLWGPSSDALPMLVETMDTTEFDLVHIDGGHGDDVFAADLDWCLQHTRPGCRVLVDDCYVPYICDRLQAACASGHLIEVEAEIPTSGENRLFALADRTSGAAR